MVQIVQPWLDQLSDNIGKSCSVAILDGTEIVYIARAAQRRVMSINLLPGSRLPAHCTSLGRVLLAGLPEAECLDILRASDLSPRTPFSLTEPNEIMDAIRSARETGYAVIDQEVETGLRSLAVPLSNSRGQVVAALNIGMAISQDPPETMVDLYLPSLRKVQSGLQRML